MNNTKRIANLRENEYQALFGVRKPTFEAMLAVPEDGFKRLHAQGGRPPRLSVPDKPVVSLGYWREYRAMEHMAFGCGVTKSRICDYIKWAEGTLLQSGLFALPSKHALLGLGAEIEAVIADATEQETGSNGVQISKKIL